MAISLMHHTAQHASRSCLLSMPPPDRSSASPWNGSSTANFKTDRGYFSYHDRVCNTVACAIALKTWTSGAGAIERGVECIQKNLQAMEMEVDAHVTDGFEITLLALVSYLKRIQLELPYRVPISSRMSAEIEKRIAKIPMDILHKGPTALLHSLEGFLEELDRAKLVKLQGENGSLLGSPATTAACQVLTTDEKVLRYLTRFVDRSDNAVRTVYPVDPFEHMWVVDRLQRLGIDRYFEKEINACLDSVYKYFTSDGIGWASGSPVQDLHDTSLGFRLLRQHGYDVSEDVFRQFSGENSDFRFFARQSDQAVTCMLSFYRAAQTRFPGETLLEAGEHFARAFLVERHEKNECFDTAVITKDLPGEVDYALKTHWYCNLPRLETEAYIGQYGPTDVWIGKSLYRMPDIKNETFLALAKADFNLCQAKHLEELEIHTRWCEGLGFGTMKFARLVAVEGIFSGACILPGLESSVTRKAWTEGCVLTTVVDDYFDASGNIYDKRRFLAAFKERNPSLMDGATDEAQRLFNGFYHGVQVQIQEGAVEQGREIGYHLENIWVALLTVGLREAEWAESGYFPSFDEYLDAAVTSYAMGPIVGWALFFLGERLSDEIVDDPKRLRIFYLMSLVGRLCNDIQGWRREKTQNKPNAVSILVRENPGWTEENAISRVKAIREEAMQELVRETHRPSHIPRSVLQLHFNMARVSMLFYKDTDGFSNRSAMAALMEKVLYRPVV